jgi:hypothetical protein
LTRGLVRRETGGRDIPSGAWTFAYAQGARADRTVITSPEPRTIYTFYGIGGERGICDLGPNGLPTLYPWKMGLPVSKSIDDRAAVVLSETYDWQVSERISPDSEFVGP